MRVTCGEAIIGLLEHYRVKTVFGIPGVHTLELYRGLTGSPIRHVTPRHEQGAGFMADAWARVTGQPGVCIVISGPGVTNAATPIAQAYRDSVPLLVLSSVVATTDLGKEHAPLHDLPDQRALMEQITAFSYTIREVEELPQLFARAYDVFDSGRPRPVHIEIPIDVLAQSSPPLNPGRTAASRPTPAAAEIGTAAALLAGASTPMILLGGGAVDAGAEALALANRLQAPIVLTVNAKGAVTSTDPLCLGATLPLEPVYELLEEADVVVAVGTEFGETDLWYLPRPLQLNGKLIRVDIDREQLNRSFEPAVGLLGDAAATLHQLDEALGGYERGSGADGVERANRARSAIRWPDEIQQYRPLVEMLDEALPDDRIVVCDSTQPAYSAWHCMPSTRTRSWLAPASYGTLGCALPMSIGAKLAAPDRPVICIAGDGGFLFSIQELATAAELKLPLPIVLWNNGGYGEIRDEMDRHGIAHLGTEATAHDFRAIAEGFGCRAERPTTRHALQEVVAEAFEHDRPTLIELHPAREWGSHGATKEGT
jgi:acetolactate synthase-1/2/3 large subunit